MNLKKLILLALVFTGAGVVCRAETPSLPAFEDVVKIAGDLVENLPRTAQRGLANPAVLLVEENRPVIGAQVDSAGNRVVVVSPSMIHLVNQIAHARAIDRSMPGFSQRYAQILAQQGASGTVPAAADVSRAACWTDDVLNEQRSNFNQIFGVLIGIQLSHHATGVCDRHAPELLSLPESLRSLNAVIKPPEWQKAVSIGVQSALASGYGVDGFLGLCDFVDRMPVKPDWAVQAYPPFAKSKEIRKELDAMERKFFSGKRN